MFRSASLLALASTLALALPADAGDRHRIRLPGGVSVNLPSQTQLISAVNPTTRYITGKPRIVPHHPVRHCYRPAPTIRPINWRPFVPPTPTRTWYFGVSLQRTQTPYGPGLQVASVTPGAPASLAGLEPGDVLLSAGSVSLQNAVSNEHGVQLLQSAVGFGSAPAPTAATTYIAPQPIANVRLTVLDVRTAQLAYLNVQPQHVGGPSPIPTAPAPTFSSPAPVAGAPAVSSARTF